MPKKKSPIISRVELKNGTVCYGTGGKMPSKKGCTRGRRYTADVITAVILAADLLRVEAVRTLKKACELAGIAPTQFLDYFKSVDDVKGQDQDLGFCPLRRWGYDPRYDVMQQVLTAPTQVPAAALPAKTAKAPAKAKKAKIVPPVSTKPVAATAKEIKSLRELKKLQQAGGVITVVFNV